MSEVLLYRGTSLIRKRPPSRAAVGIGPLKGPKGRHFLMSEVLLFMGEVPLCMD